MKINNKIKYILLITFFINFAYFLFTPIYFSVVLFVISMLISAILVNLIYSITKLLYNKQSN